MPPKSICPKVNVIVRLEYELGYYDSAVHRFNHYTTSPLPPQEIVCSSKIAQAQSAGSVECTDCISAEG